MNMSYELHYLEYQEKLQRCKNNYRLSDLPQRRLRLPTWQQIRTLLFL